MLRKKIEEIITLKVADLMSEWNVPAEMRKIELTSTPNPSMGDYALSTGLKLAKFAKMPPIKIAQKIADSISNETYWFNKIETVPPGYVNITLSSECISKTFDEAAINNLGLKHKGKAQTVVVDYSGVNIAKQLHVGHLRSTIIGDSIARVLEARGENVIRQNHLGDWGLPIAMVLWKAQPILREIEDESLDIESILTLAKLEDIYREAAATCKENKADREKCQQILVALQNGDEQLIKDWQTITRVSMNEVYRLYELLGVKLYISSERGESFYRDMLQDTVDNLVSADLVKEDAGAMCVFMDQFKAKDGSVLPVIIQKSDGGFNYDTFDLAAIRYRIDNLQSDRVIYVTDSRQSLHFEQVFAVAEKCGWTSRNDDVTVKLEHVAFGSVLGEDGKPLKTRSGENVKLADLTSEAIDRAYTVVNEKNPGLSESYKQEVARMVGIGAIKYADLSHERIKDYVFAWDRMLALDGNTGPYLQYAHARICSIFRKGEINENEIAGPAIPEKEIERILSLKLLEFARVTEVVEDELKPHILCTYLYELADIFTSFYDQCPVLSADTKEQKESRLYLCRMVQRTISTGLDLLGIGAPREM